MWGIIPAAGAGSRIQPLAFSKELLPVGSRIESGVERPRAVSEYLVERMIRGGADKLCFVISPGKSDILQYYGSRLWGVDIVYVVQPTPGGLCDALFRAVPLVSSEEPVVIGLPDTVWSPADALLHLPDDRLSFLTFPVQRPELFDAVVSNSTGEILRIEVKQARATSQWIWGAVKMPGSIYRQLHALWCLPDRQDEYLGTLVNAWLAAGGSALAVPLGEDYVDTGTLHGYRAAIRLLESRTEDGTTEGTVPLPDAVERDEC